MYEVADDRYCYSGTQVLKNIPGHRNQSDLDLFEIAITTQRASEPLPSGRLDVRHFKAVHFHLFQDVYRWAGRARLIRISKGGGMFCYPENIGSELKRLFWISEPGNSFGPMTRTNLRELRLTFWRSSTRSTPSVTATVERKCRS